MAAALPASFTEEKLVQLAREVREIRLAMKEPEPGVTRRWLQGPSYTDLILDTQAGRIIRLELTFAGHWVLAEGGQLFTGRTDEMDTHTGHPVARLVERDQLLSHPVAEAARLLVRNLTDQVLAKELLPLLGEAAPV